jgi:hypothetical protein
MGPYGIPWTDCATRDIALQLEGKCELRNQGIVQPVYGMTALYLIHEF